MPEPNDPIAYRNEMQALRKKYEEALDKIWEEHKNDPGPFGLDDGPGSEEWEQLRRQMLADIHRVRRKYGIE